MPPGASAIRSGTIQLFLHEPVETRGLDIGDRAELIARVRGPMEETLSRFRKAAATTL
jgi:hypothetical protein